MSVNCQLRLDVMDVIQKGHFDRVQNGTSKLLVEGEGDGVLLQPPSFRLLLSCST